ncbi:MAG: flagellar biosynthetic protein FliR [Betaproteobacteria bacterium]
MEVFGPQILEMLKGYLWPMVRVSAFFLTAPFFGLSAINLRVKIGLAIVLTWLILPRVAVPEIDPLSFSSIFLLGQEVIIGVYMGLFLQIVVAALVAAGQLIAGGMGLSMANMIDPNLGNVPTLAQFFLLIGMLLFISLGGHLILITILQYSFEVMPIAGEVITPLMIQSLIDWSGTMFIGAAAIGFPIVFGLLLINASVGLIARAAPSLNVFAIGFPALIPAGLIMLMITTPIWFEQLENLWFLAFQTLRTSMLG